MLLNHNYAVVCWGLLHFFFHVLFLVYCVWNKFESGVSSSSCRPIENLRFVCRKSFSFTLLELLLLFQFVCSTIFINYLLTLLHKPTESRFKCNLNILRKITKWDVTINYVVDRTNTSRNVVELSITYNFNSRNIISLPLLKSSFSHSVLVLKSNIALSKSGLPLAIAQSLT